MKKKILLFTLIAALALGICGCGKTVNKSDDNKTDAAKEVEAVQETEAAQEAGESEEVEGDDYMTKHIRSINPSDRAEFLAFWQDAIAYCRMIKLELRELGNTASYEFDPTDESQIPAALSEIDFSELAQDNAKNLHKDFVLGIDGEDVTLSFDGIDIYPTDYVYSDIEKIIESL